MKVSVGDKLHKNSVRWIWHIMGKYKFFVFVLLVFQITLGIFGVLFAMLFRNLIDYAVAGDEEGFFLSAGMLVGLEVFELALNVFNRFLTEWTSSSLENRLKERLFFNLIRKDYAAVTARHSGEWITRLTSDTVEVTRGIIEIGPGVAGMLVRLTGALLLLFFLDPFFGYILIPLGLVLLVSTAAFRGILKRLHKRIQETNASVLSFLQERLENLMIIRVFSMEKQSCKEAEMRMEKHKKARIKRNHFSNFCNTGFGAVISGGYVLAAGYCGYGILQRTLSYGTFIAVLQLIGQIQAPFANISGIVPKYYAMVASAERLMEAESYPDDREGEIMPVEEILRCYREELHSIGMRNAVFSYQTSEQENNTMKNRMVLKDFNLDIRKGDYVAFTGHSGCGKSTLLKLLMCLYPLNEGRRYLLLKKGEEMAEYPLTAAWRGLFAYVPQDNQLMSGSIREIITFGVEKSMMQEERMEQALNIACADEFVYDLEKGIDTILGERGSGLSEGQMQRIAIARAIFSDRPVLILDEATSALDETTEQKLLKNLQQMTDKTVLIVTHRPAALEICNREVSMQDGEI